MVILIAWLLLVVPLKMLEVFLMKLILRGSLWLYVFWECWTIVVNGDECMCDGYEDNLSSVFNCISYALI
jgi:hypothetical protein